MNKVWIDVRTPKQALIASIIMKELSEKGYETLVTTRKYDYTISNLERNGIRPIVIGGYGDSLYEKLLVELERGVKLAEIVKKEKPCVLVSYPSPSAARVAFGLGIRHIALCDTSHAFAANRLDFPFADIAIYSSFIADEMIWHILEKFTTIVTYKGVDELMWIKGFKPNRKVLNDLGLEEYRYVIVRPEEFKAHYYTEDRPFVLKLVDLIRKKELKPVVLPRYEDQLVIVKNIENIIVPKKAVDGPSLEKYAALVITGGGTMAREAALQGTPGISLFPRQIKQDIILRKIGFPIYNLNTKENSLAIINSMLDDPIKFRVDTSNLLGRLESPLPYISEWVARLCRHY
ncbi:MAG: DUF354 domain-containing protein [Desulfurococcales archaeon]|nr:DUF354 domain-containing protein [Desulfurococcales archaeon]